MCVCSSKLEMEATQSDACDSDHVNASPFDKLKFKQHVCVTERVMEIYGISWTSC